MEQEIEKVLHEIIAHKQAISNGFRVSKDAFYVKFHTEIEVLIAEYQTASTNYNAALDKLYTQLENRRQAITAEFAFSPPADVSDALNAVRPKYESIHQQSNEYTNSLARAKQEAQRILRLHEVRTFIDTIGYSSELTKIARLETKKTEAGKITQILKAQITEKLTAIEDLKCKLNDEEKGALKVNEYLNHFFGHQFLTLKAIANTDASTGTKQIRFEIMRGEQKAFNLSEGECSLIAFCYFMAKLNDVGTSDKKPIIWIDDPISSLDGNHIFFVYSLLRAEIVDKKNFAQLFASTHNLEFLKYLKRLNGKDEQSRDYQKAWFVVERENETSSIKMMPKYLKEYITEFNYLFH